MRLSHAVVTILVPVMNVTVASAQEPRSAVHALTVVADRLALELLNSGAEVNPDAAVSKEHLTALEATIEGVLQLEVPAPAQLPDHATDPTGLEGAVTRVSFDAQAGHLVLTTLDEVVPRPDVACDEVRARLVLARVQGALLSRVIREVLRAVDQDLLSPPLLAWAIDQVRAVAVTLAQTFPASWDDKIYDIKRTWHRPAPVIPADGESCGETGPLAWRSLDTFSGTDVVWHNHLLAKERWPSVLSLETGLDRVVVHELASLTSICLEPRTLQIRGLVGVAGTSRLAPPPLSIVLRADAGGPWEADE